MVEMGHSLWVAFKRFKLDPKSFKDAEEAVKWVQVIFRKMAMEAHPDKGGNPEEFDKLKKSMDAIEEAHANKKLDDWLSTRNINTEVIRDIVHITPPEYLPVTRLRYSETGEHIDNVPFMFLGYPIGLRRDQEIQAICVGKTLKSRSFAWTPGRKGVKILRSVDLDGIKRPRFVTDWTAAHYECRKNITQESHNVRRLKSFQLSPAATAVIPFRLIAENFMERISFNVKLGYQEGSIVLWSVGDGVIIPELQLLFAQKGSELPTQNQTRDILFEFQRLLMVRAKKQEKELYRKQKGGEYGKKA